MDFLTLIGGPAFTPTQAEELKGRINKHAGLESPVASLTGKWIYYVHLKGSDKQTVTQKLVRWLEMPADQASADMPSNTPTTKTYYVTPRNISPWSSKGTSITHVCGLKDQIERIERGQAITVTFDQGLTKDTDAIPFKDIIYDRMTETIGLAQPDLNTIFVEGQRYPLEIVDIFAAGAQTPLERLRDHNKKFGLALDESEMEYLVEVFKRQGRPPHDVELFMFAQVNSEHCRHKQFNASWTIDGEQMADSLFGMIRNTHKTTPDYTVSAYSDNAAVLEGETAAFWAPDYSTGSWKLTKEVVHILAKVETHNHPTAISPFPGAATGAGGEIRDEGAVGRGSKPKAGLCGFWVSDLLIPDEKAPWEVDIGKPAHFASSLDIMLEAPIGSARFNNEFGRPCLLGCFRTLLTNVGNDDEPEWRGYHKPIMIAGGVGTVRPQHALKDPKDVNDGAHVIVLGGPAMLIGLGGGAASSAASTEDTAELDFASVQRGNPEMERRAQMVIDTCVSLGDESPIAFIHDVGAGGLSNALPELVKDAGFGGKFELRQVHTDDKSLSPLQLWANESQERYVLLVNKDSLNRFVSICRRERCPFSDVGTVLAEDEDGNSKLILSDRDSTEHPLPIDLPMSALFPPGRRLQRVVERRELDLPTFNAVASLKSALSDTASNADLITAATERVFRMPTAPVSAIITAVSVVEDVRRTWTPQLRRVEDVGETILVYVDLAEGKQAMGGSALAQSFGQLGNEAPDVRNVGLITDYFDALKQLHESGVVLAYHDRSDGGLITTIAEMMFAGRCGVELLLDGVAKSGSAADVLEALFNEELGAVFQVRKSDETNFKRCFATCGPPKGLIRKIGVVKATSKQELTIRYQDPTPIVNLDRVEMQQWWSRTSYAMQRERDSPAHADSEFATIADSEDPGISFNLKFQPKEDINPLTATVGSFFKNAPKVAILREVGVNSHAEMAFAFKAAGFDPIDVHMSDILAGRSLREFVGLAAGGGFSYGDVFGAGVGWAQSILEHKHARQEFEAFFNRPDTFSLGVCNGCQMITRLKELIPGAADWPTFSHNASRQFEARFGMVTIDDSRAATPSVFLHGMSGSSLPIAVSHGEGRAAFTSPTQLDTLGAEGLAPLRYVDNRRRIAEPECYPANPNGSPGGVAGVRSKDGRVLALMPHPERTIMADVASYVPPSQIEEWGEFGPWVRMFKSARRWVG
ncbi:hypothetical protein BN1708_001240 [Verticillium longisporum]|uniref:Phosphoribosylformylglycinamidine synthase n=1 Tax=Verticillium longisporum TaxID=100787 RepID=A0A0G4MN23_VERLO|nr:hypothetical protein BN1708_001240 [Verticillium longisporum]